MSVEVSETIDAAIRCLPDASCPTMIVTGVAPLSATVAAAVAAGKPGPGALP